MGSSNSKQQLINNNIIEEIKQIEEWTKMKIGNIIFDSDVDNWNKSTSVFDQKVLNKSNLIFLIEDDGSNLFGGYIHSEISCVNRWINDSKAFLFSLKSNGRLNDMFKFDVKYSRYSFYLFNKSFDNLFDFGCICDIGIYKENLKHQSNCCQHSFKYNKIENALCGKIFPQRFTILRIIVIQMV